MEKRKGLTASEGAAYGILRFYREMTAEHTAPYTGSDAKQRFRDAVRQAQAELSHLEDETARKIGTEEAAIFSVQRMMAGEEDFLCGVEEALDSGRTLEEAIRGSTDQICRVLQDTGDEYLSRRCGDVQDVASRLLRILAGEKEVCHAEKEPIVLAAPDIPPSAAAALDPRQVCGICTEQGSVQGHTAILCRTLRIPAVVSVGKIPQSWEGRRVLLLASQGEFILEPNEGEMARFREEQEQQAQLRALYEDARGKASQTRDGHEVLVYANASSPREIRAAMENDADGIGLLRSEVLFLSRSEPPDEETQTAYYRTCTETARGRRLIIRTLDIGADKNTPYFPAEPEDNPALGNRAIRFCLSHPDLFLTQLRAILRAAASGNIAIMFPLIVSCEEIRKAKQLLQEARSSLSREGKLYREQIELGIMIETPAAALIARELANEVDFFSIGTNDLAQYALAADRQNAAVSDLLACEHEAVFRLIAESIAAAHDAGIWCGICGEIASDPTLTERLVALGVDELSVLPSSVLPIRTAIRQSTFKSASAPRKE